MPTKKSTNKQQKAASTTRLYWLHEVDLSTGIEPSAYGIKLTKVDDHYFADVPESRAKVELEGRKGYCFTDVDPNVKTKAPVVPPPPAE